MAASSVVSVLHFNFWILMASGKHGLPAPFNGGKGLLDFSRDLNVHATSINGKPTLIVHYMFYPCSGTQCLITRPH